jgi:Leucine-rich repeat (LRR) protein
MKRFDDFITENVLNKEFETASDYLQAKGFVSENGLWNYSKSITIENKHRNLLIKDGKLVVRFGKIEGDFNIQGGGTKTKLISSEGLPTSCRKLDITYNEITNLEGIGDIKSLDAANNMITSLKGSPRVINGSFDVEDNKLTTLKGGPEHVYGYFDCSENELTDLQGCPTTDNSIYLHGNLFKTFYGLKKIDRSIDLIFDKDNSHKVPEEEITFLRNKISTTGYVFDNYIIELILYVVDNFESKGVRNLNLPDDKIDTLPDDIKNIYISSMGLNKFNM